MFKWLQKKERAYDDILSEMREIKKNLQQVTDTNCALQNELRKLQEEVKQKDSQLDELKKKYRVQDGFLLSDEQSAVFDLLEKTDDCYFITGKAGTGKSTVLKYFVANTRKKVVVLAPTGIAANIIGGRTIHSFFRLSLSIQDVNKSEDVNSGINADDKLIEELDAIVIDEASMIRADVMDMIDHKLKVAKGCLSPYGGVQIILFGDLFQLPPVVKKEEAPIIQHKYGTPYFFGVPSAKKCFTVCGLKRIFRQTDAIFINTLNRIRIGVATQAELDNMYAICRNGNSHKEINDMYIVPTNKQADKINSEKLNLLSSKEYTYYAICEGDATEDDAPTSMKIVLKVGATVMLLCNDVNKNYFNGSLAKVTELTENMIKVSIAGVGIISIDPYTWPKYEYEYNEEEDKIERKQTGSFTQFPLKLAYAITVHKSQGQTFEHATIDYKENGAFASGQTYVALSRCRRLEDICLTRPLQISDIKVSHEVMEYMRNKAVSAKQYAEDRLSC